MPGLCATGDIQTPVSNFVPAPETLPTFGYFKSVNTGDVFNVVTRIDLGTGSYASTSGALKLTPESPIAHLEHGNLLLLLHGDKREDDAANAFEKAGKLKPRDAMEALDAEFARAQLE